MIKREQYLKRLRTLKDQNIIKIVTGIRRCGKSTLLMQFRNELLRDPKVAKSQVIYYNLESKLNKRFIEDADALHDEVQSRLKTSKNQKLYVFIDEVQLIPEFEKTIDSLFIEPNIDLYLTGSNAYLSSSEIATLLTGRYIEIKMTPLSFTEFCQFFPGKDQAAIFGDYLTYGGFPEVANLLSSNATTEVVAYLKSIYQTILEKDVELSGEVRSMTDFENLTKFCLGNVGNITSPNKIANTMTANHQTIDTKTVEKYLKILQNCFVFYKAERFDIKGRKLLQTLQKYYSVDIALINAILGASFASDLGHKLENIVYLELKRRFDDVWIGKNYNKEIDFVARSFDGTTEYFQVSQTIADPKTRERELTVFPNTNSFPRTILTLDPLDTLESKGIKHRNLQKWLLEA